MLRLFLYGILPVALALYATLDCARTASDEMPARLPKPLWILVIILMFYVGPIAWIIVSRVVQAEKNGGVLHGGVWSNPGPSAVKFPSRRPRPADQGPDGDPNFLRDVDKMLRDKQREEYQRRQEEAKNQGKDEGPKPDSEGPEEDSES